MVLKRIYIAILFFLFIQNVFSQNSVQIDSLEIVLKNESNQENKAAVYLQLSKALPEKLIGKALNYAKEGLAISIDEKDELLMADFNAQIGKLYSRIGVYDEALNHILKAYQLYEKLNNMYGQFMTLNNLGTLYSYIEDFDNSLLYYQKAYSLFIQNSSEFSENNRSDIGALLSNIGSLYDKLGDTAKAMEYYEKGLEEVITGNSPKIEAMLYNNLGKMNFKNNNQLLANQYILKSIEIRKRINDRFGLGKSYYFLANYHLKNNSLDSANLYAFNCLTLGKEIKSLELQRMAYWLISELNELEGNHEEALMNFKLFKSYNDSILNEQKLNQISQLQTNYKIQEYEKDVEIEKQNIRFNYTIWIFILSTIALLSIGLLVIFKIQKHKLQLEKTNLQLEVDFKNKELTTNVIYLFRKNELINMVAKKLLQLKDNLKKENVPIVRGIIYDLQSEVDNEVWKEFEARFQQVHSNFYENLKKEHPDLSPAEERLCAFLKLKLNTKEISAITHQSARGVDVARGRLRKKLGLTNTDINLMNYFEQF